jgi:hypothetical protein
MVADTSSQRLLERPVLMFEGPAGEALAGFGAFWLKYPKAFNPNYHCINCLVGTKSRRVTRDMPRGVPVTLSEDPTTEFLYLCGVSWGYCNAARFQADVSPFLAENLHVPVRRKPGAVVTGTTYNGVPFTFGNVEAVEMPEAVPDEFRRMRWSFRRCRNFIWGARWLPRVGPEPQLGLFAVKGERR